jgi:hypothetical protein
MAERAPRVLVRGARAASVAVPLLALGCDAVFGLADRPLLPTDASALDRGEADAAPPDAAADAASCPAGPTGLPDIAQAACWSTFDTSTLGAKIAGFEGTAFDGRYLYLVPNPGTTVVRYDTSMDFTSAAAWLTFDVGEALGLSSAVFAGAVFYGSALILVPGKTSVFVRYDTQGGFTDPTSWSSLDPFAGSGVTAPGYAGGTFDGEHLYFVPYTSPYTTEFDTTKGTFSELHAWSAIQVGEINDLLPDFVGGTFDGRYVYMSPGSVQGDNLGFVLRYDTSMGFTVPAAFDTFDMNDLNMKGGAFAGAAFDGTYIYFVPSGQAGESVVTRLDSKGTFADDSAWQAFDLSSLASGVGDFFGAAFDGRFVYLVPSGTAASGPNGRLARYDIQATFGAAASWETFDTSAIGAASFRGSAFDGQYVYFAPGQGSVVARFEARTSPATVSLPGFHGSFF